MHSADASTVTTEVTVHLLWYETRLDRIKREKIILIVTLFDTNKLNVVTFSIHFMTCATILCVMTEGTSFQIRTLLTCKKQQKTFWSSNVTF